jgi:uncharacterized membrane protein SpoIIM required for sporulation
VIVLRSAEFRRERDASWAALERLVLRVERGGLSALDAEDLARLPTLYRSALSSLSVARAITLDRNVLEYLEALCARAYLCVHGPRRGVLGSLAAFFRERFPRVVRARIRPVALAAALLLAGAAAGFALVATDPDRFVTLVPEGLAGDRGPEATTAELRSVLYQPPDDASLFSASLWTHNANVGILSFALGFAAGLPTFLLILTNGLVLGAFASLYHSRGLGLELWAWVLPHGVPELTALVLCAAAGLVVARSLVFPGRSTRLENLAREGRDAGVLVGGAVALLLVAGLFEGVFRQAVHSVPVRLAVASLNALALTSYLALAGRTRT